MKTDLKKLDWLVEALAFYAREDGLTRKQAFDNTRVSGAFDFINRHYEVEHQLSFEDVLEDIRAVSRRGA